MVPHREQPFILPLLLRILWLGELIEAVGEDQATAAGELAALERKL